MILILTQTITDAPIESPQKFLVWAIGILIFVIGFLVTYFTLKEKNLRDELKEERAYSRDQDKESVKLFTEITGFMSRSIISTDKNSDHLNAINKIQITINTKLDAILNHFK